MSETDVTRWVGVTVVHICVGKLRQRCPILSAKGYCRLLAQPIRSKTGWNRNLKPHWPFVDRIRDNCSRKSSGSELSFIVDTNWVEWGLLSTGTIFSHFGVTQTHLEVFRIRLHSKFCPRNWFKQSRAWGHGNCDCPCTSEPYYLRLISYLVLLFFSPPLALPRSSLQMKSSLWEHICSGETINTENWSCDIFHCFCNCSVSLRVKG